MEFPTTSTCEDTLVTSSEPSVVSAEITHDEDVNTKTRAMSDEVKSDKSLPDIPAPRKPDNVTVTVPEEDRDLEKFYCDYCKYCFFTNEGLRQHMDNAHFRCLEEIYRDDPVYVDQRRKGRQQHEDISRGRTKRKQQTSAKERNDSVGGRKRVRMATQQKESDSSTEVVERRRTRSRSSLILEDTKRKEEEMKNVQDRENSLEMSKEEYVKSYNLRKKDDTGKSSLQKESDKSKRKSKDDDDKGGTDGKSENTVRAENGSKDTEPTVNIGKIASKIDSREGDEIANDKESASQNDFNVYDNGEEGQSQDNDTAPDSAYQTENDTDTRNERSESTALDDTQNDPDFDVEKEEEKNNDLTITADETNKGEEEEESAEVTPIIEKKRKKKSASKKFVNKQPASKYKSANDDDEEEDDFYYHCDRCSQKFDDWKELQKHKLDCVKVPRKFACSKCNRGFQQKKMMEQHFDFYHTKKPKKYVCNEHNKCYVYKKSYDEHLCRDHSDGNYRFVCDYCGKRFFHKSEFSIHRDSVHLKRKDYACNKCQERAFTSIGRLNAHLAICGKEAKEQCGICGKMYSTKETLFIHINDVHKDGVTRQCPFCDEKVYTSEGGYYKHMHVKHNISQNTIKLSDYMKAQASGEKKFLRR